MATVAATDCDTAAKGYLVINDSTLNVPTYWTGVQGGELPEDPANPKAGEVEHKFVSSGSLNTFSLNEADTALCQEIVGYESYGNNLLSVYRRWKSVDPNLPTGWSTWDRVE